MGISFKMTAEGMAWLFTAWILGKLSMSNTELMHILNLGRYNLLCALGFVMILIGLASIFSSQ